MIITKQKTLAQHKEAVGERLKNLSQKFLLGAVCAGLMLNSFIPAGRSFAEGAVASIPQEMFMTKDELLQLCEGRTGENSLLAGKDTDKKIRINFGTRPEVVKYYSDMGNTAHEVAAGAMTWLLVGSEDGNSAVLYSEKPMISANQLKYPDNNYYEPTQGETDSRFQIDTSNKKYTPETDSGYPSTAELSVYPNHWGVSNLRGQLNALFNSSNWFTTGEKAYMAQSKITTSDQKNKDTGGNYIDYTTLDVLYAPRLKSSDYNYPNNTAVTAGESDSFMVNKAYWEGYSWLRSPYPNGTYHALVAVPGGDVYYSSALDTEPAVVAAFKLDVQPFSFLSAASSVAITRSSEAFAPIAVDTPMALRLDGTAELAGAKVTSNGTKLTYSAPADSRLMVIATTNDGKTYQFSHSIATAAADATLDLFDVAGDLLGETVVAKAWIEKDAEGQLTYATEPISLSETLVKIEEPGTPGDSSQAPETPEGSEGNTNPSNPAEALDKDNQNGTAADQGTTLDIVKTGDKVTCFAISTLSLAAALSFGALLSSKAHKKKSDK